MNIDQVQKKLLAAARADQPSDRVPYAFEKRIMARLKDSPVADVLAYWERMLWRATAPCAAIMIALSAWTFYTAQGNGSEINLEDTVLAPVQLASE
ncbi:MAG TPA: hypothetical protein VI454_03350 [Verrucomicrobiae bacterium]|jgi:hypothetical protein